MSFHRLSPAILTLLVFLLAQGLGTVLLLITGQMTAPDFSMSLSTTQFSLVLMTINIVAVLACYIFLHNIRLVTTDDISSIVWRPGMLAIAGGLLGAMCISVLTDGVKLPDMMQQMSLAMSRNALGIIVLTFVGPVTEELLFREAIEGEMLRRGARPWTAIFVSAIAFSTVHLNLAQGLYALPIGIIFGIIYYKTGNIVLTALLHILNNAIAAVQLCIMGESLEDLSYAEWFGSAAAAYVFMVLSGLLSLVLMKQFWTRYPSHKN